MEKHMSIQHHIYQRIYADLERGDEETARKRLECFPEHYVKED